MSVGPSDSRLITYTHCGFDTGFCVFRNQGSMCALMGLSRALCCRRHSRGACADCLNFLIRDTSTALWTVYVSIFICVVSTNAKYSSICVHVYLEPWSTVQQACLDGISVIAIYFSTYFLTYSGAQRRAKCHADQSRQAARAMCYNPKRPLL